MHTYLFVDADDEMYVRCSFWLQRALELKLRLEKMEPRDQNERAEVPVSDTAFLQVFTMNMVCT